jgi:hypothetical protein
MTAWHPRLGDCSVSEGRRWRQRYPLCDGRQPNDGHADDQIGLMEGGAIVRGLLYVKRAGPKPPKSICFGRDV